MLLTLVTGE